MRAIIVDCCVNCFHMEEHTTPFRCNHETVVEERGTKHRLIPDCAGDIPEWCPLEKAARCKTGEDDRFILPPEVTCRTGRRRRTTDRRKKI